MKRGKSNRKIIRIALKLVLICSASKSLANPSGMTVSLGSATAQQLGSQLDITVGQLTVLNWSSFDIGAGETTTFLQPSSGSIVFNIVNSGNPSQIFGNLNANGTVILANANGLYFGPDSMIKVGGSFIATTAPLPLDVGSGSAWQFTGMPPLASIVNYGQIQVGQGRSLFLIAENVQNYGQLNAPAGNIALAAGQTVLVSDSPDGRGLSAQVQLPQGSVDNFGNITADAGAIALQAQVVNQEGIIQANSVQNQAGVIELTASDDLTLGANSQISANGDGSAGGSAGGTVTLQSGNNFSDSSGSQISAVGGSQGGNGGSVEVSAPKVLSLNSTVNEGAQNGASAGTFIFDPENIILEQTSSSATTYPNGIVNESGTSDGTTTIYVSNAFSGVTAGSILLEASGYILFDKGVVWNLGTGTGLLTLEAGGDIVFDNGSEILDANNWSVTLEAGYNFSTQSVQAGAGNIYLNGDPGSTYLDAPSATQSGSAMIQLASGSINLWAAQSIEVGTGSIFTTGGGSIFADALDGDVNAGTSNGSTSSGVNGAQSADYMFSSIFGARPNTTLGGISTKAGGNVTLIASDDIISVPTVPASTDWPGASGTYGAGNVTLVAGNQITGNFNLANGTGYILAGVQATGTETTALQNQITDPADYQCALENLESAVMLSTSGSGNIGSSSSIAGQNDGVTLSLIEGSWNVWAANDIYLNEVNNPNGTFNSSQGFAFNYAANAAVNLWAGYAINLLANDGNRLARVSGDSSTPIYAPILTLNAGEGGITVDDSIILYPSSEGALQIITRNGGNLSGADSTSSSTLTGITMSDSGSTSWSDFASGHAATPLYLNNPNPVILDISGSIESFGLTIPTFADINVVDNTYNFGFMGQNLSPNQTTSINVGQTAKANMEAAGVLNPATDGGLPVGGSITYRGDLTSEVLFSSETLSGAITTSQFADVISDDPSLAGVLSYNPTAGTISYSGVMSAATEYLLQNLPNANAIFTASQLAAWNSGIAQLYANTLSSIITSAQFEEIISDNPSLAGALSYDPTTGTISYIGQMSTTTKNSLQNLPDADVIFTGSQLTAWNSSIAQLYTDSQSASLGDNGLALSGPGNFSITANNIDLGISGGISVLAPDLALAAISPYGANIVITTAGDLEMTTSVIANESLFGGIDLNVGGTLDVGGELTPFGDADSPKGIFTTSGGNIRIRVTDDVNVDGSRIAAYDGGNVNVASSTGDINAGEGGAGRVTLDALEFDPSTGGLEIDPNTGQPMEIAATIPGSGILATTVFGSDASLGNITLNAPNGSVDAQQGGVIQIAFNGANAENNYIKINAGDDINAQGSGIIGSNIKLQAGGSINGVVIGSQSIDINSAQNVNVTAVSSGNVDINASGDVSGTIVSGGNLDVSGSSIDASLVAENVNASGDTAGASMGIPQSNVAPVNTPTADNANNVASKADDNDNGDEKKKQKPVALAQKVSRVTVTLPTKNNPRAQNQNSSPSS